MMLLVLLLAILLVVFGCVIVHLAKQIERLEDSLADANNELFSTQQALMQARRQLSAIEKSPTRPAEKRYPPYVPPLPFANGKPVATGQDGQSEPMTVIYPSMM